MRSYIKSWNTLQGIYSLAIIKSRLMMKIYMKTLNG